MTIYKAQPTGGDSVPDLRIVATEEFPRYDTVAEDSRVMAEQANEIARQLRASLPGGVFDRLVARLVSVHACGLVVAHGRIDERADRC